MEKYISVNKRSFESLINLNHQLCNSILEALALAIGSDDPGENTYYEFKSQHTEYRTPIGMEDDPSFFGPIGEPHPFGHQKDLPQKIKDTYTCDLAREKIHAAYEDLNALKFLLCDE